MFINICMAKEFTWFHNQSLTENIIVHFIWKTTRDQRASTLLLPQGLQTSKYSTELVI